MQFTQVIYNVKIQGKSGTKRKKKHLDFHT